MMDANLIMHVKRWFGCCYDCWKIVQKKKKNAHDIVDLHMIKVVDQQSKLDALGLF